MQRIKQQKKHKTERVFGETAPFCFYTNMRLLLLGLAWLSVVRRDLLDGSYKTCKPLDFRGNNDLCCASVRRLCKGFEALESDNVVLRIGIVQLNKAFRKGVLYKLN